MKREDLETSGENLVRYKKEPSGCPVCGKVTPRARVWNLKYRAHHFLTSKLRVSPTEYPGEKILV